MWNEFYYKLEFPIQMEYLILKEIELCTEIIIDSALHMLTDKRALDVHQSRKWVVDKMIPRLAEPYDPSDVFKLSLRKGEAGISLLKRNNDLWLNF